MITRHHRRVIAPTNIYIIHYSGRQIRQTTTEQTAEFWWTSLSRTAGTLSRSPRLTCHIVLRPYFTASVAALSWRNMTRNTDWTCRGQDYDQEHRLEIVQEYDQEERLEYDQEKCRGQEHDQAHRLHIGQEYDQRDRLDMQESGT